MLNGTRNRLAAEQGLAMPAAVTVLMIVLALVATVASTTIAGTRSAHRASTAEQALAAADAAADIAMYRLNRINPDIGECLQDQAGVISGGAAPVGQWCPAMDGKLSDGRSWVVQTTAGNQVNLQCESIEERKIVAIGMSGNVAQRVIVKARGAVGGSFGSCAVRANNILTIGGSAKLYGDATTNNILRLEGYAELCGDIYYRNLDQDDDTTRKGCGTYPYIHDTDPNYPTGAVDASCNPTDPTLTWKSTACNDAISHPGWNSSTRKLTLSGSDSLTLTGKVYSFCQIEMTGNARLYISPRDLNATTKIVIDDPDNCPGLGNPANFKPFVKVEGTSAIINRNSDPTTLQIMMRGRQDPTTGPRPKILISTNPNEEYTNAILYAPTSEVELEQRARLVGAIVGHEVRLAGAGANGDDAGGARVYWSDDVLKLNATTFSVAPAFTREWSVNCTPPAAAVLAGDYTDVTTGCSQ